MSLENVWIILVEDDPDDRHLVVFMLRKLGAVCMVMQNTTLMQSIENMEIPDIIITDLQMPNLSGYDLLEAIHQQPHLDSVPVVAYTSHLNEMPNARKHGFHSFLGKPLSGDKFAQQIERILQGEHVWEVR